jgi:hypothetical protein
MFQLFFTHIFDQTEEQVRFAVLYEGTAQSVEEISSIQVPLSVRFILARNNETGEKVFFNVTKEQFFTPKAKDIRLVKVGQCARCTGDGVYAGPSGATMSTTIRGGYRVLLPLCFDCHGTGFWKPKTK